MLSCYCLSTKLYTNSVTGLEVATVRYTIAHQSTCKIQTITLMCFRLQGLRSIERPQGTSEIRETKTLRLHRLPCWL